MNDDGQIARLIELIDRSSRIVFFTGAGISTESGIPDFRSPGTGIWNKIKPIEFQDFLSSKEAQTESWKRKFSGEDRMASAQPNRGHKAISQLFSLGKVSAVITQNVDNLHQESGVPDSEVIELHGNAGYATCLNCNLRYELSELRSQFKDLGQIEPCRKCGGVIKTATISFGQPMPMGPMQRAQDETIGCDLFIVVGTSLVVYPAAGFPEMAADLGIPLVIINREPTPLDPIATLAIHEEIGPTLSFVVGVN